MKLSAQDYAQAIMGHKMASLLRNSGDIETSLSASRLQGIAIDRPLFIAGLARAGSTILLNLLARADGVATHRYRDFPFVWLPLAWNWLQDRLATPQPEVERPHRDRIRITKESPEAFEEPIWQEFFPWVHDPHHLHALDADLQAPDFEAFFRDHIRKILLLRGGRRYLSKGNYNVARIAYLGRLFPDARFIVPVRAPLSHVHSLVKQHRLFSGYAERDRRVGPYLRAAGHYEFGPQRQPINLTPSGAERVREAWAAGDEYRGYAVLWSEVYGHVHRLMAADRAFAERIFPVIYRQFCAAPHAVLARILDFAELRAAGAHLLDDLSQVSAAADDSADLPAAIQDVVRRETADTAARFGYSA